MQVPVEVQEGKNHIPRELEMPSKINSKVEFAIKAREAIRGGRITICSGLEIQHWQQFPENRERLSISGDLNGRRAYLSADTAVS